MGAGASLDWAAEGFVLRSNGEISVTETNSLGNANSNEFFFIFLFLQGGIVEQ